MAEYTPKQRRRGLEFANQIAAFAAKAPDDVSKRALHMAAQTIRKVHGFSDKDKRDLILKSLSLGCSTYDDLVIETRMAKNQVIEIIKSMETEQIIELRTLKTGERGGRPIVYIHLIDPSVL